MHKDPKTTPSEHSEAELKQVKDDATKRAALNKMLEDGENSGFIEYSYRALIAELDDANAAANQ